MLEAFSENDMRGIAWTPDGKGNISKPQILETSEMNWEVGLARRAEQASMK